MSAKILVADESPTIHKTVAMAFEDQGFTVEGISRGEHALEYMAEFQPDIVLADIHLPGTDGYELCRQIKNSPSFGSVRVILLTSDFEDIDKVELEISRADDFISKPFKTEEILNKVKSQLKTLGLETDVLAKKADSPLEPENNEVILSEIEDIISQPKESSADPVQQLFTEDKEPNSSIDKIDLETHASSKPNTKESLKETPQDKPKLNEVSPEIILDLSEEAFRAETRPVKLNMDDLNSVFQSVLSTPRSGPEDAPKGKPGSRPNLIEETLSFIAHHPAEERSGIALSPETGAKKEPASRRDSAGSTLADRIIEQHMDHITSQIPEDARHDTPASFEKTVRAVLGEVAPKIIRQVIKEEIENIKKMKGA